MASVFRSFSSHVSLSSAISFSDVCINKTTLSIISYIEGLSKYMDSIFYRIYLICSGHLHLFFPARPITMATCCKEKANSTLLIWTEHLKYGLCYLHIPTLSFFKHFSFTFCFSRLSTVKGVIVEPKQQVNFIQPHFIWDQVVSLPFGRGKGRLTTWSHIKCLRHQPCYPLQ